MSLIKYRAHCAFTGWLPVVDDGKIAGTVGQARRLEAIRITELNIPNSGINAKIHVQDLGWSEFGGIGQDIGSTGIEKHAEALIIGLTGEAYNTHDIFYRVHCAGIGWMNWAKNGEISGTVGGNVQVEAVQILIKPKSDNFDPHVDTVDTYRDLTPQNPPPAPPVDTRAKMLEIARSHLGYVTGTSEDSFFGRRIAGEIAGDWCCYYVVCCAIDAGVNVPITGYVPSMYQWALDTGRWTGNPEPGFFVLYDFGGGPNDEPNGTPDHIGIVDQVYASNHVLADEGNTGDPIGVYQKDRSEYIMGYINPF